MKPVIFSHCVVQVAMGGGTAMKTVSSQPRRGMEKFKVYQVVLKRLRDSENKEASQPGFEDELCNHFNRLPPRYSWPLPR